MTGLIMIPVLPSGVSCRLFLCGSHAAAAQDFAPIFSGNRTVRQREKAGIVSGNDDRGDSLFLSLAALSEDISSSS